jgi:predicted nucleotidyltransferase
LGEDAKEVAGSSKDQSGDCQAERRGVEMILEINAYMSKLSELCARYGVNRLEVFGSAAHGNFDPRHSDVDFLVDFAEKHPLCAFERYF